MTWRGATLVLALLFLVAISYNSNRDWRRYLKSAHSIEHTYQVLVSAEELRTSIEDTERGRRVYLVTGEERHLNLYRASLSRITANQKKLQLLVDDNPQQQARLEALSRITATKLNELPETLKEPFERRVEEALRGLRTDQDRKEMEEVRRITGDVREEEYRLLRERSTQAEANIVRTRRVGSLSVLVLIALLIIAAIAIERDVRRRRRDGESLRDSEEQFRQVFDQSPGGILLIEDDLRIRRANPALCRLLGYQEGELQEAALSTIAPGEIAPVADQCTIQRQYRAKSGGTVWVNVNTAIVRNSRGGVLYNLALIEDITTRKKADQDIRDLNDSLEDRVAKRTSELAESNRESEQINKELESFAYSVSHDLRAPLRSIDGFSQIILDEYADKLDQDGVMYLHRIRAGTQSMSQLIEGLLNLSRWSRAELHRGPVDLTSIALSIVNEWREREPGRVVNARIGAGLQAGGDARLLRVVLENLLGNAWKFTGKCEKACLEFGVMDQQGETVYLVRDNGAGFDMAYASQLFAPFQRLHQAAEFGGTGIGLATVQRIVHRHGGRIWAESSVSCGAAFYFTLAGGGDEHQETPQRLI